MKSRQYFEYKYGESVTLTSKYLTLGFMFLIYKLIY